MRAGFVMVTTTVAITAMKTPRSAEETVRSQTPLFFTQSTTQYALEILDLLHTTL